MTDNDTHGRASPATIGGIVLVCLVVVTAGMAGLSLGQQQQSEEEPNNQQSAATQLDIPPNTPTDVNGVLGFLDEDWFAFDAQEGDTITIDYSGSPGEARLRGPDGTVLDAESSTIQRLQATAEQDGTHYVQLTTIAAANGDYSMEFRVQRADDETETATPDESETDTETATPVETSEDTGEQVVTTAPDGEWPDTCDEAPMMNASGVYRGTMDTPGDVDRFKIRLAEKGEYVVVRPLVPPAEGAIAINVDPAEGAISWQFLYVQDGVSTSADLLKATNRDGIDNSTARVYAEVSPTVVCFTIADEQPGNVDFPYEWQMRLTHPEAEPSGLDDQVFTREEVMEFEERLAALERRVDRLEQEDNSTSGED